MPRKKGEVRFSRPSLLGHYVDGFWELSKSETQLPSGALFPFFVWKGSL